MLSKIAF